MFFYHKCFVLSYWALALRILIICIYHFHIASLLIFCLTSGRNEKYDMVLHNIGIWIERKLYVSPWSVTSSWHVSYSNLRFIYNINVNAEVCSFQGNGASVAYWDLYSYQQGECCITATYFPPCFNCTQKFKSNELRVSVSVSCRVYRSQGLTQIWGDTVSHSTLSWWCNCVRTFFLHYKPSARKGTSTTT